MKDNIQEQILYSIEEVGDRLTSLLLMILVPTMFFMFFLLNEKGYFNPLLMSQLVISVAGFFSLVLIFMSMQLFVSAINKRRILSDARENVKNS